MAQTIFEQLAPYAGMTVVPGVTVGRLNYANQQTTFADSTIALATANTTQAVPANSELQFFTTALTEVGQGFGGPLTLGQTNSKFSKGQPPANQVLVATSFSVGAYYITRAMAQSPAVAQTYLLPTSRDLFAIIQNFSWDLQIGRGISRTIGSLLEYPDDGGAWSVTRQNDANPNFAEFAGAQNGVPACHTVKLPIPIIFPPLVNVGISAKCGNTFALQDVAAPAQEEANAQLVLRVSLGGFLMTMPV